MKQFLTIMFSIHLIFYLQSTAQTWDTIGSGANDKVLALKAFDGGLAIGGEFTEMNGMTSRCLAYILPNSPGYYVSLKIIGDFNSSATLSNIPGANVMAMEDFDDRLHIGGNLFHPFYFGKVGMAYLEYDSFNDNYDFHIYNNQTENEIKALKATGDKLFIGGSFTNFAGTSYIAYIDSGDYPAPIPFTPGNGLDGIVYCIAVYNNEIYAGGSFSFSGITAVDNIAKWNGSQWTTVGTGTSGTVYSMEVFNSELIVGGDFSNAGGVSVNNIAKWNNSTWSALNDGLSGSFFGSVHALKRYGNNLFAGGDFDKSDTIPLSNLAKWDGIVWSSLGTGTNDRVLSLETFDNHLFIGGEFDTANAVAANYIVSYSDGSGTNIDRAETNSGDFIVYPNPTSGKMDIYCNSLNCNFNITVLNITGKIVSHSESHKGKAKMDLTGLPQGLYFVKTYTAHKVQIMKILLQ